MTISSLSIDSIDSLKSKLANELFAAVQHKQWATLLDTCKNQLSDGRYDIIVYKPAATYQFKSGRSVLNIYSDSAKVLEKQSLSHSPFDDLSKLHQVFSAQFDCQSQQNSSLPYLIGALGLLGYDINTHTDHIHDAAPDQYQLADIAIGFYDQSLIFDNYTGEVFHVHANASSANAKSVSDWLAPFLAFDTTVTEAPQQPFYLTRDWQANMNEGEYVASMQRISEHLHAGDCYQINFAQRFSAAYNHFEPGSEWAAYSMLRKVNKAPFSSFMRVGESCVLSLSPERFISVKNGQVVTKPIKGTRKRAKDAEQDRYLAQQLLDSEKDKAENLMIVDLLRNDLSKHCQPHSVKVPHLFALESYPAVHHMVSTVVGTLKSKASPFDLLAGAFPGGSITGAPKVRAMQIIQDLEPDKRSIYCGSIGYVGIRNDMDTNICIRTILAEKGMMHCWAGGGIVLDSQAQDEYQESFDKVAKILPVLSKTLAPDSKSICNNNRVEQESIDHGKSEKAK